MSLILKSNTTNQSDDGATLQYTPGIIVSLIIFIVIFILGLLGNGLVIWVAGLKMKRTVNTVWFLHLAIADFLCCMSLPFSIVHLILHGHWPYGDFLCKVIPSAMILNMFASVFLLTAISIDRCLMVMKPIWCQNHRTVRLASVICGCIWLLALVMCCPAFLYRKTVKVEHNKTVCSYHFGDRRDYGDNVNSGKDSAMSSGISLDKFPTKDPIDSELTKPSDSPSNVGISRTSSVLHSELSDTPGGFSSANIPDSNYKNNLLLGNISISSQSTTQLTIGITRIVFGFLIPFCIMAACYILIAVKMHGARFTKSRGKKTLRVILFVVIVFFVCWVPYHVVGVLLAMPGTASSEAVKLWKPLSAALAYSNSCINPLLYVFVGRNFRRKAHQSLRGILEGAFSEEVTRFNARASRDRCKTSADRDTSNNAL